MGGLVTHMPAEVGTCCHQSMALAGCWEDKDPAVSRDPLDTDFQSLHSHIRSKSHDPNVTHILYKTSFHGGCD